MSIVSGLAVAAILVFFFDRQIGLPSPEPPPPAVDTSIQLPPIGENTIAVLPFVNLDGSNETQVFADGLVEDVITQLSRVPGLRVAARGDSYTLQPNSASQEVRNRLRVAIYLEGSVQLSKGIMRVTVQMIDSASGFHILSRRFDRPREEFFDVRDEITDLTVANVRVALPPDVAYVLYRRGLEAARQPKSIHTIASALGWFDAALNIDTEYAAAHAGKCTVYAEGYTEIDDPSFIDKAELACGTALELNPNLDVVHTALGDLYRSTGRYQEAETAYQAALATDPSNAESLSGLGFIYLRQGRFEKAETALRKAVDIHPGNTRNYNLLGLFLYETGRYTEAIQQYEYVVALEPDNMIGYTNLGAANMLAGNFDAAAWAYGKALEVEPTAGAYSNLGLMNYYLGDLQAAIENHSNAVALQPNDHLARSNLGDSLWVAGREEEARLTFEKAESLVQEALRVNPNDPFSMMDLAWIEAMLGNHDDARSLMGRVRTRLPDDPYTYYYDALVWLRAGDKSAALDALETAVEKGYSRQLLSAEPHLDALRGENRFMSIVAGS
jgi:TolB-like protein/Flp pilus assembly protein TadD